MFTLIRVRSFRTLLPAAAFVIAAIVGFYHAPTPVHAGGVCTPCTAMECFALQNDSNRIHLSGHLYAFQADSRSHLAGDTVRVYGGDSLPADVNAGTSQVSGELLVEQKLGTNGLLDVCFDQRPWIYLEVLATDQTQCNSMMINTVFSSATPSTIFAYSPIIALGAQCGTLDVTIPSQYVDQWGMGMTTNRALAFYETSLLVNDYRKFLAANTTLNLPSDVATTVFFGESCPGQSASCYREPNNSSNVSPGIYLHPQHLGDGFVIDHEFSHRIHDAIGGFTSDPNKAHVIQEGIAEFIRLNKEDWTNNQPGTSPQTTNRLYINGNTVAVYEAYQNLTYPPTSAGMVDYAAWLWDLDDSHSDQLQGCDNGAYWTDDSTLNFSSMLNTFDDKDYIYHSDPPERVWSQSYIQRTSLSQTELDNMEKVSRAHRMYDPCGRGNDFP